MDYHNGLRIVNDGSGPPSIASSAYNSPQPSQILIDENQRFYVPLGADEQGVWRQYVGPDNSSRELVCLPYPPADYQQRQTLRPQPAYPNPMLYGEPHMALGSNHTSGRPTPRSTPEPNVTYQRPTAPTKRKPVKKPKEKVKRAALEKPLSELTKGYNEIPVRDTEAFVNRSVEERRSEKRPDGSIKRPSNSFMLYRSAYTERCRELEKSKNHQDISSIAGASWAIETPEIKSQFEDWAKQERENHQKAFPNYKFQPQTQAAKERKRKHTPDTASVEDFSDLEDPTYYNGRGTSIAARRSTRAAKNARITRREYSDSPTLPSQDEANTPPPYMLTQSSSYFGDINPGKPPPQAFNRWGQPGYYVTSTPEEHYGGYGPSLSENGLPLYQTDVGGYETMAPPVGLPGASHDDLMGDMPLNGANIMFSGPPVLDPELTGHDKGMLNMAMPGSARSAVFNPEDLFEGYD